MNPWETIVAIFDAAGPLQLVFDGDPVAAGNGAEVSIADKPAQSARDEASDAGKLAQPAQDDAKDRATPARRRGRSSLPAGAAEDSSAIEAPLPDASAPSAPTPATPFPEGKDGAATLASETGDDPGEPWEGGDETELAALLKECSVLDKSDTDNGKRLIAYFGRDLCVMKQEGTAGGDWLAWTGKYWDLAGGLAGATRLAQRVGDLIKREADYLELSEQEARAVAAAKAAKAERADIFMSVPPEQFTAEQIARLEELNAAIDAGKRAQSALSARRRDHRKFGVVSKNRARVSAMMDMAAPHLRIPPEAFNPETLAVATETHTLRFVKRIVDDPDDPQAREDGTVERWVIEATEGHRREDWITALAPVGYDRDAACPRWIANMERFQPDPAMRRTVQQFDGLGLTARPIQKLMYHYGPGANFKSVHLETLGRVLGDSLAIGLPSETLSGFNNDSSGSKPTPDIARVFGKRMLRVLEMPQDVPLKAEIIKKLTGGEKWPCRTLYKAFFEFVPYAKTHMSGNGFPAFDGSDGGMKRRLIVVPWEVIIPEAEQRDDVVDELAAEGSGILNWLVAGCLDYLNNGLVLAEHIREATAGYIDDMDPAGQYARAHVVPDPAPDAPGVTARAMYHGYVAWAEANGKKPMSETRFGKIMKRKFRRDDTGRVHVYPGVRLHDVPERVPPPSERASSHAAAADALASAASGPGDYVF